MVHFKGGPAHSSGGLSPRSWGTAQLSLLHPLDRYRTPYAIGNAIGRLYLALSRILAQVGVLNRLVLNHIGRSTARLWCYSH